MVQIHQRRINNMKRNPFLPLSMIILLMSGCTLAPEYSRPVSPVPAQWPTGAAYSETKTVYICACSNGAAVAGVYHR